MIEVSSNGALNLIVDAGRLAAMPMGVSKGGAMDPYALELANMMVGNDATAAGIEVGIFPFRARFEVDTLIAIAGAACNACIGEHRLPPYWCRWVREGETLVLEPPALGARVYIAVAGGVDVPKILGSRSTDTRAEFGGIDGRGLKRGDRLPIGVSRARERPHGQTARGFGVAPRAVKALFTELASSVVTLRCLAAAEYDKFTPASVAKFSETQYVVSPESNRMGYRLEGSAMELAEPVELLSHGIVPGTVQVPPSGQPIIQLADANTCGGYPKMATVIECDLWKLGQVRPGLRLRFQLIEQEEALKVTRQHQTDLCHIASNLELVAGRI